MTQRHTHRWYGIAGIAFVLAGTGIITNRPTLLLASIVGIAYATYAAAATPPTIDLDITRTLSDPTPSLDDPVTVTLTITNHGPTITDLRLIDGVPPYLAVKDGSPRLGTSLRTGKTAAYSYTVTAHRGVHTFDPITIIARDPSGAIEHETTQTVDTTLTCIPALEPTPAPIPLRAQTTQFAGTVSADEPGAGVEFYATREYRPGDPIGSIDWNRLARTGDLTTIQYHEERRATIVLLLDTRRDAYVGGTPHAVEHLIEAARTTFATLLDHGHRVGIGAISPTPFWLAPNTGAAHRARARQHLATHPAFDTTPPEDRIVATLILGELLRQLPHHAQIYAYSPMTDDNIEAAIARLDAAGHPVTAITPDVTGTDTPGRHLARTERQLRIDRLRQHRLPVIDWQPPESFETTLVNAAPTLG